VKNLLSLAVNRGDLRKLNYNKTVFGRGSAPDLAGRAHGAVPDTIESYKEGIFPPHSPPSRIGTQGRLVLFLNWYPHFLEQSYALATMVTSSELR